MSFRSIFVPVLVGVLCSITGICEGESPKEKYLEKMDRTLNADKKTDADELNPPGMKEKYAEINAARDTQLMQDALFDEDQDEYIQDYDDQELDKNYTTD